MEREHTYSGIVGFGFGDDSLHSFEQFLCNMSSTENCQYELVFPAEMIEHICKEKNYPCYKFAHNLEGDSYMRARVNRITLEFLVRNKSKNQKEKESLILQIRNNGQMIYLKPDEPAGVFYVV